LLEAKGQNIRLMTRATSPQDNLQDLKGEIVHGDLTDADSLRARVEGNRIHIERRKIDGTPGAIEVIPPSAEAGEGEIVEMSRTSPGLWPGVWQARETGIYRITDGTRRAVAAVGTVNPPELADLRTTAEKLRPLIQGPRGAQGGAGGGGGGGGGAGGSVTWLVDGDLPDIRRTRPGRDAAGRGWIGLRDNGEYRVVSVADVPLVPIALVLALALGGSVLAWMREAR